MDLRLEHQDNLDDNHEYTDGRDTEDKNRQAEHKFEKSFHIFRGRDA
jgi:hypothetical protein